MRRRKSSLSITLVLIGTAALSGCGNDRDQNTRVMRRDVYSSLEDCRADWGRADDCETASNLSSRSSSNAGGTTSHYGPRYYWADSSGRYDNPTPRPGSRATSVATVGGTSSGSHSSGLHSSGSSSSSSVSRGGFGSSSAAHGGSSS